MTTTDEEVSKDNKVPYHERELTYSGANDVLPGTPTGAGSHLTKFPSPDNTPATLRVKRGNNASPSSSHKFPASEAQISPDLEGVDVAAPCPRKISPPNSVCSRSRARSNSSSSLSSCISDPIFPSLDNLESLKKTESDEGVHSDIKFPQPSERTSRNPTSTAPRKSRVSKTSRYFPKLPSKKLKREPGSCIPFPPLESNRFGLVQESLSHDPFLLFIAVIFLNKTRGAVAMPVFYNLISQYPTPASLAAADQQDIVAIFAHLGLQNQRARKCIGLAQTWLESPPVKGKRHRRLHYPQKGDGKDISTTEAPLGDDDPRVAWEVSHLVGIGSYGIDSWRIFCRDELRGLPGGLPSLVELQDSGVREAELAKEWTRVLPTDKELRAYLRWRWLRLGFEWDCVTGERKVADLKMLEEARYGGIIYEGEEGCAMEGAVRRVANEETNQFVGNTVAAKAEGAGKDEIEAETEAIAQRKGNTTETQPID